MITNTALVPIALKVLLLRGGAYVKDKASRNKNRDCMVQKILKESQRTKGYRVLTTL